jgi:hypothetical protein
MLQRTRARCATGFRMDLCTCFVEATVTGVLMERESVADMLQSLGDGQVRLSAAYVCGCVMNMCLKSGSRWLTCCMELYTCFVEAKLTCVFLHVFAFLRFCGIFGVCAYTPSCKIE